MEMNSSGSLRDAFEARTEKLLMFRQNLDELGSTVEDFEGEVSKLEPALRLRAVRLAFSKDGVLEHVTIDERLRADLTEDDLLKQFAFEFAAAPMPGAFVTRLLADPTAMNAVRNEESGPTVQTFTEPRGVLTLFTQFGRPKRLTARAGSLLARTSVELGDELVRLARIAADASLGADS